MLSILYIAAKFVAHLKYVAIYSITLSVSWYDSTHIYVIFEHSTMYEPLYLNDYDNLNDLFEHLNYIYLLHILCIYLYNSYQITYITNLQPNAPRSGQDLTTINLSPLTGACHTPYPDTVGFRQDVDN